MPLRVVYFVSTYHRFTGGQRSLWLLVRGLDRARVDPVVMMAGEGYATRMFRELGVPVEVVKTKGSTAGFGGDLLRAGLLRRAAVAVSEVAPYTLRVLRRLRRLRAHVLHVNDARGLLLAGPAAKLLGIPVVWHVRGDARSLGAFYRTACGMLADRIVLVADGVRPSLERRLWPKCVTVYNGIDPPLGKPRRGRAELLAAAGLSLDEGVPLAVAVGSIVPMKGIHHLIEAAAQVSRRMGLVVVGDAPQEWYRVWLERRVAELGLRDVRFPGWDHEATDWIAAADVVCLPTVDQETMTFDGVRRTAINSEGFSRTVLEAMLHERAVVASAVVGIPEQIVGGETGLLVPPSDPAALARALDTLAGDAALRERLGAAAGRRVRERFTVRRMVEGTMRVYEGLRSG
jgi:glycosyltransferase involved in cell wall biosynthesis